MFIRSSTVSAEIACCTALLFISVDNEDEEDEQSMLEGHPCFREMLTVDWLVISSQVDH